MRCAELTVETGYDYFIIAAGGTEAKQGVVTTPGSYTATTTGSATFVGDTAVGSATMFGTYTPGQTIFITKHTSTAVIKVFKGEKPPDNPNAYVANEVLHYLGPSVRK